MRIQSLRGERLKPARLAVAALVYCAILLAVWFGFHRSAHLALTGIDVPRAFVSFALLLAPLWFLGFGAAEPLKELSPWAKMVGAGLLALPYFVFALGTEGFGWRGAVIVSALPVLLAASLELPRLPRELTGRDLAVLTIVAETYFLRWLQGAWPYPALAVFPKLFLADIVLYCFLIIRKIDAAGYNLVPSVSALVTGLREWAFFVPIAFVVGELTGFIHFHAALPSPGKVVAGIIVTFLLIALPEELFFRAVLQNLLETRLGRSGALFLAAILFGLSHFHHGATFNWKYVVLASIAGVFYGRAWRERRQILAAIVTHTGVDLVWSLWFR